LSTAKIALRSLHDPNVAELTARTTIDFNVLRDEPTALFIQVPETELDYYSFFLSALYTQLFKFVLSADPLDTQLRPILFLLDEAGNIHIPNLATIATTIRRRRASLSLVLQDLDQLTALYGQEANAIVRGGMLTRLYFGGLDQATCEVLERTLGKETVTYTESGYGTSTDPMKTRSTEMSRSLMTADEIRLMKDNAILLCSNKRPLLIQPQPWYKQPKLVKRTK